MTEQKFTPGPWAVRKSESKQAYNVVGTKLGGKWKIARCPATVYNMPDLDEKGMIEAKANALLASCAPEMLNMLQEAFLQIEYLSEKFSQTATATTVLQKINTLIEKATTL